MHRFYLPPEQCAGSELTLAGPEAHHALHVLRIKSGERVTVVDGCGTYILCKVVHCTRNSVRFAVLHRNTTEPPPYRITIVQAVTKPKAFEFIIQKATELGAWRIVPLDTARTTPELKPGTITSKLAKWQRIAIEAIKQSGNPWLPKIESPASVNDLVARKERFDLELVACLHGKPVHPRECLASYVAQHGKLPNTICVWIGPEGDFTTAELDIITTKPAYPITLGPRILRAETAAIYCLAILNYELTAPEAHRQLSQPQ